MKRSLLYIVLSFSSCNLLFAQNSIDNVLKQIEANSTTLQAIKAENEAQKLQNKSGIFLDDPEVEFAYLWGSPSDIPSRKDFSVTQNFDLATVLGAKSKFANSQNNLLELQYKQERLNILLEAKKTLVELVYTNKMMKELEERYSQAKEMSDIYHKKLDKGDANILESNKVDLSLSTTLGEMQRLDVERQALLNNLKRLNGGKSIEFKSTDYEAALLSSSFEEWYSQAEQKNPVLQCVQGELEMNKEQLRLSKAMGLPSIKVGYTSELVKGSNYRGASIGVSVPLWSNKNRVKQAKAAIQATEARMTDAKQQFYSQLAIQYNKTKGLQEVAYEYSNSLNKLNNTQLLKKALSSGQISLLEYLVEIGLYYDNVNNALNAEKDYQISLAELQAVEL